MHYRLKFVSGAVLGAALAVTAGCVRDTKPSDFYLLEPTAVASAAPTQDPSMVVGPVTIPQHLDRPHIVTRAGSGRLDIDEFSRWAEPLSHSIPSVIAANLTALTGSERIIPYLQVRDLDVDFRVMAIVSRFDADAAGEVVLDVKWAVLRPGESTDTIAHRSVYRGRAAPGDYGERVATMNSLLLQWSEAITERIRERMNSST